MNIKKRNKGQLVWDNLIPWIIGIAVLVLGMIVYLVISGKMNSAAAFLKNLKIFGK